jgi:hypothetical protein
VAVRKIDRVLQVAPMPGSDASLAYAVHFDGGSEPSVVIEYANSVFASASHARQLVAPYLNAEVVPRRLVVDREGNVRVREANFSRFRAGYRWSRPCSSSSAV